MYYRKHLSDARAARIYNRLYKEEFHKKKLGKECMSRTVKDFFLTMGETEDQNCFGKGILFC